MVAILVIQKILQNDPKTVGSELVDIPSTPSTQEILKLTIFIVIGIPTWYYGEAQCGGMTSFQLWKKLISR